MSFNVSGKKSRRAPWFDLKKGSKCHRLYFQFVHLINIYWASSQCPNYTRHWGWSWKDKFLRSAPNVVSCSEGERSITDNYNDVGLLLWCNINRVLWDPRREGSWLWDQALREGDLWAVSQRVNRRNSPGRKKEKDIPSRGNEVWKSRDINRILHLGNDEKFCAAEIEEASETGRWWSQPEGSAGAMLKGPFSIILWPMEIFLGG